MSLYSRNDDKRSILDYRRRHDSVIGSLCRRIGSRPISPKSQVEEEKWVKRQIANSNERKRMQSINNGFNSLRHLLPHQGEKLSKAAILQQTADYIYQLEQEKTRLLAQNSQLKRLLDHQHALNDSDGGRDSPMPKRKKASPVPVDSLDDCGGKNKEDSIDEIRREMIDLRMQLDRERRLRLMIEDQTRSLEAKLQAQSSRNHASGPNHKKGFTYLKSDSSTPPETPGMVLGPGEEVLVTAVKYNHHYAKEESCSSNPSPPPVSILKPILEPQQPQPVISEPPPQQVYVTNSSRQSLETIVEAIRHLEGDHLFDEIAHEEHEKLEERDTCNPSEEGRGAKGDEDQPLELTTQSRRNGSGNEPRPGVIVVQQLFPPHT